MRSKKMKRIDVEDYKKRNTGLISNSEEREERLVLAKKINKLIDYSKELSKKIERLEKNYEF